MSDSLAWGRRFRVLCIIDDFSRECLGAIVDTSISGHRVARELDRIAGLRGYPCRSSWSWLFSDKVRRFGRSAASAIASASL